MSPRVGIEYIFYFRREACIKRRFRYFISKGANTIHRETILSCNCAGLISITTPYKSTKIGDKMTENQAMFCFQCQETARNKGCTVRGVCGKTSDVANLQYALLHAVKGLAYWLVRARKHDLQHQEMDHFIAKMLFSTITNANFDPDWFLDRINRAARQIQTVRAAVENKEQSSDDLPTAAIFSGKFEAKDIPFLVKTGKEHNPLSHEGDDIRSLKEMLMYGLKGLSAYADHALVLGYEDDAIWAFLEKALASELDRSLKIDELLELIDECGAVGVTTMALLDKANTETFGIPEPTKVDIGVKPGPGILVSGHDLLDLYELLEQTKGKGINIYTHGEMLPAHAYPKLKQYDHLVANYGGSWWKQKNEFEKFNGPILLTTNCLVPPKNSYLDRLHVTGNVGWPGAKYIPNSEVGGNKDFSELIDQALQLPAPEELESGSVMTGFSHNAVLGAADKVIEAVKSGAIKRFVVMAGCDGRMKSREYFTEVAKKLPDDTIILTAGCAKYRYNKLDLGMIGDFPRVLDAGQCNDSYSLAVIALKLVEAFGVDSLNDLPLSFDIGWYEQKAVLVLLVLLHLGVKNIHLGPTLPGFLSPGVAKVIIDKWNLQLTTDPSTDIETMMNE